MRLLCALSLALLAAPAGAEAPCDVLAALLAETFGPDLTLEGLAADGPGTCRAPQGQFGQGPYAPVWTFGPAEIQSPGLGPLITEGIAPESLRLSVGNVRLRISLDDPVMDYLIDLQTLRTGIDLTLDLGWDAGAGRLSVTEARVDFPGESLIRLSAVIDGLDLSNPASMASSVGGAGLTALSAEIVADGLFEAYLLVPLGSALLTGEGDPAAEVAALKAQGQSLLARVPETLLDAESRAALAALIGEMPTPRGTLRLDLAAEPMLGAVRATPFLLHGTSLGLDALWPALDGVTLRAAWEPLE